MNVYQKRPIFRRRSESSVYRMFFWIVLILGGIWLIRSVQRGDIKPLFQPAPTPTRIAASYALEGEALFTAGKLEDSKDPDGNVTTGAISAYREAVRLNPTDAESWARLARIQTYSTALLTTDPQIKARLAEALDSINQAVELAPDDSLVHAVRAFVLDWNSNPALVCSLEEVTSKGTCKASISFLTQANQEAERALQLDSKNALALAFFAEILVDQQRWTQADQYIGQALELDPSLMDVHRVHAYVLESAAQYALAIEAYDRAIAIAPNLTFLYMRSGANYRRLGFASMMRDPTQDSTKNPLFLQSLDYFAQAARINDQLQVYDPVPYVSIAKTYSQMGQFFIAIRNMQKAIEYQPDNPNLYGELGILYHKNRNYENGILALKCALRGCTAEESCPARGDCGKADVPTEVKPLSLSPSTIYFFDVYGSELAALSRPSQNYCSDALGVFAEIRAGGFDSDPNIANDIRAGEEICRSLAEGNVTSPSPHTTGTPGGGLGRMPTPTP
jgi:tetratricopeptide (TPR) repeat protein